MSKDIYDLLNDITTDADEQLANNSFEELSDSETKDIMSKLSASLKASQNATTEDTDNKETDNKETDKEVQTEAKTEEAITDNSNILDFNAEKAKAEKSSNKSSIKSNKKKYLPIVMGIAAALVLSVSLWAWKTFNKTDDSSNPTVASNATTDASTEITTEATEEVTTEEKTTEEKTTEEKEPTVEKHDFNLVCAYANTPELASSTDSLPNDEFNVSIWNAHGNSDFNWTRMLFSVSGDDISSLHISIDKCALYTQTATDIDPEAFLNSTTELSEWGIEEPTATKTWAIFDPYGIVESIDIVEVVGGDYSCSYSPNQMFGFYIPPEEISSVISNEDIEALGYYDWQYYEPIVDLLRNATLTVDVTYNDGETISKQYTIHAGQLKYYTTDAGFKVATSEFAGEGEDGEFGLVLEEVQ